MGKIHLLLDGFRSPLNVRFKLSGLFFLKDLLDKFEVMEFGVPNEELFYSFA